MRKYFIRKELIARVSEITKSYHDNPPSDGLSGEINKLRQRAETTKLFTDEIIATLNQIISEEAIQMSEHEEMNLVKYLKPTILELIQKHFV